MFAIFFKNSGVLKSHAEALRVSGSELADYMCDFVAQFRLSVVGKLQLG